MGNQCSPQCDNGDAEWRQFVEDNTIFSSIVYKPAPLFGTTRRFATLRKDNRLDIFQSDAIPTSENVTPEVSIDMSEATFIESYEIEDEYQFGFTIFTESTSHTFYVNDLITQREWLDHLMPEGDNDDVEIEFKHGKPEEEEEEEEERQYSYSADDSMSECSTDCVSPYHPEQSCDDLEHPSFLENGRKYGHSSAITSSNLSSCSDLHSSQSPSKKITSRYDICGLWLDNMNEYIYVEDSGQCSFATKCWEIDFEATRWSLNGGEIFLDLQNSTVKYMLWRNASGKLIHDWRRVDRLFSEEDLQFFDKNGYVKLRNAVSEEHCRAVSRELWQHFDANPNLRKSWLRVSRTQLDEGINDGYVDFTEHQSLWNNRQHPKIYKAFAELYSTHKLWVSSEGLCLKLPDSIASLADNNNNRIRTKYDKSTLYWKNLNPWEEEYIFQVQGMLALSDSTTSSSGFQCVPECHHFLRDLTKNYENPTFATHRFEKDHSPIEVPEEMKKTLKQKIKIISMKKGDLIIWRSELPHGIRVNRSQVPHEAQYISLVPAAYNSKCPRNTSPIATSHDQSSHKTSRSSSVVNSKELLQTTRLTPLGLKLAGIQSWPLECTRL